MNKQVPSPSFVNEKIIFSFEQYDTSRKEYCISEWDKDRIKTALIRLKDVNSKTFNELNSQRKVYHFSEVDWSKTSEKGGFGNSQLDSLQPFHFALLGVNGQKARIFGAYGSGIFYIVWFDFDHKVWPSFLKNT